MRALSFSRPHNPGFSFRGGFTLVEAMVVVLVVVVVVGVVLPSLGGSHCGSRQIKCAANTRGIQQGMALFAQNNQDQYPIPSQLDAADATVRLAAGADAAGKDTTANIISMLIYSNHFGPEICISPAEASGNIVQDPDYEYSQPKAAIDPKNALWDPAFGADFSFKGGSNLSYAHMLPSGKRLGQWNNAFDAGIAVVGNRGPYISAVSGAGSPEVTPVFDGRSITMQIHGARGTWEGNICYNDNHSDFEATLWGDGRTTYTGAGGVRWHDLLHYDEPDDPSGVNRYLGVFQRGSATGAPMPIWD